MTASIRIAALFVQKNGCYFGLDGVDPWDEAREARRYRGPWPVVAHPPCARWCLLAGLAEYRHGLKRGEDGRCFESALHSVRTWGGVLEHPAHTAAFKHFGLPVPSDHGGWQRGLCGGWSCRVEQWHYGHAAKKPTWLYAFGVELPTLKWGPVPDGVKTSYVSDWRGKRGPVLTKKQRSATPPAFRDLLLGIAQSAQARAA